MAFRTIPKKSAVLHRGGLGVFASALVTLLLAGCGPRRAESESERLEARLDRTAVHFHLTLRARLESEGGAAYASRLASAPDSPATAAELAEELFGARQRGAARLRDGRRSDRPFAPLLVEGSTLGPELDAVAFFLSLLDAVASDSGRIPKQILVYEAAHLDIERVSDRTMSRFARAARALVFARAGYCERATEEASAASRAELTQSDVDATIAQLWPSGGLDRVRVHSDVARAISVLSGGARTCCALRRSEGRRGAVRWLDDAEALGVAPSRIAILRAWVAISEGDRAAARSHLDRLGGEPLSPADAARARIVREAIASTSAEALRDAQERVVDRRWLSALVLEGVHQAFVEDGLLSAIDAHPEAGALRRLAAGEAVVIAAARDRFPMFDQAHQGDRSFVSQFAELFR